MSWNPFSRKTAAPVETKKSAGYALHYNGLSAAKWSDRTFKAFSKEGYEMNVIVHSAINRVAKAISSIEWVVYEGDEKKDDHPILDLIRRPNPMQSRSAWWEQKIGYLMLSGNDYGERVRVNGRTKQLWNLRPDRMSVLPSPTGMPRGYEYRVGTKTKIFPSNPRTGESDIRHLKLFNPLDDWIGLSPISAGAYAVDQHNLSMNWVQSLLQNSARPSGAIVVDAETPMGDDEYARLKDELETQYSGADNAGRPLLLEGGLDWKQMGLSPIDMEILKTREMAARDISLAFGVPPLLLNIPGDNTYANYREARLGFYEDTILPLLDYLVQELNIWIVNPEYPGAVLRPDYDTIEAIADKRKSLWAMADNSDDITLNESRRLKNLPPLPSPLGDTLMAEIRRGSRDTAPAEESETAKSLEARLSEAAYGR